MEFNIEVGECHKCHKVVGLCEGKTPKECIFCCDCEQCERSAEEAANTVEREAIVTITYRQYYESDKRKPKEADREQIVALIQETLGDVVNIDDDDIEIVFTSYEHPCDDEPPQDD